MKSTYTTTYQSSFFLQALNTYLVLKDTITKVSLTKYDFETFGRNYIGLRVDYMTSFSDVELTETQVNRVNRFDSCLEIYLGKGVNVNNQSPFDSIERNTVHNAKLEIQNLIELFKGFCEDVVVDEESNINGEIEIKALVMCNTMKNLRMFD